MNESELNKLLIAKDDVDLKLLDSAEETSVMLDVISEKQDILSADQLAFKEEVMAELESLKDTEIQIEIEIV